MLRKILLPSRRIIEDGSFQKMHPSFRNLLFTAILKLDNYSGVIKISKSLLFKLMNESEAGGNDILGAMQKQHPSWIYYDEEHEQLAILLWPNCIYSDLKPRQLKVLEKDLQEVTSIEVLKKMCEHNHSSKTELIRKRLSQIQMDLINEGKAMEKLKLFLNGSPSEGPEDQHFDKQTKTKTETKTETSNISGLESPVRRGLPSSVFEDISNDQGKKKLWDRLTKKEKDLFPQVIEIVDYFKEVTGKVKTQYFTAGALRLMKRWLKEGWQVEDFKLVIDFKTDYFQTKGDLQYISLDTYCREGSFEDNHQKAVFWIEDEEEAGRAFDPDCHKEVSEEVRERYAGYYLSYVKKNFPDLVKEKGHLTVTQFESFMKESQPWNNPVAMTKKTLQTKFREIHHEAENRRLKVGVILPNRLQHSVSQLANI